MKYVDEYRDGDAARNAAAAIARWDVPENDTPGVLKEYADLRGLDTSNWSFLTGPDTAVRQLLAQLGVIREFEGATIKHTLATVLKANGYRTERRLETR